MSQFKRLLIASTWFQVIWFVAVVGSEQWQWLTLACLLITLGLSARLRAIVWQKWLLLTGIGIGIDMVNLHLGILIFDTRFLPLWLIVLWAMFMWYAQFLVPVVSRYPLALVSLIGGLAGSLSYLAGYKLGAVQLGYSIPFTFTWLFFVWAAITALCIRSLQDEEARMG